MSDVTAIFGIPYPTDDDPITDYPTLAELAAERIDDSLGIVAATVAGLGTARQGKRGLIRGSVSPYSYAALIYDAVYGKWVGDPFEIVRVSGATSGDVANFPIDNAPVQAHHALIPHKAFTDAGLTLQVRLMGVQRIGGSVLTIGVTGYPQDDGDVAAGTGTHVDAYSHASNAYTWKDSGWLTLSPAVPKKMLGLMIRCRQAAGSNSIDGSYRLAGRWIG